METIQRLENENSCNPLNFSVTVVKHKKSLRAFATVFPIPYNSWQCKAEVNDWNYKWIKHSFWQGLLITPFFYLNENQSANKNKRALIIMFRKNMSNLKTRRTVDKMVKFLC